jgi:glycerol-3-phosphate O-acyltransferase
MSVYQDPTLAIVRKAMNLLSKFIETKKDGLYTQITASKDYKNILMLSYYRNNLIHLFLNEGYIASSLEAFGDTTTST